MTGSGHSKAERRRFNRVQRRFLFLIADGRCSSCGAELDKSWHADHVMAWAAAGATTIDNGAALCPPCNQRKGARSSPDPWEWREFQDDCAAIVAGRFEDGKKSSTLHIVTGLGKTGLMVRIHSELNRRTGQKLRALVYVPRLTLAKQVAVKFQNQVEKVDGIDRPLEIGRIRSHGPDTNQPPFIPPSSHVVISTYSALARDNGKVQGALVGGWPHYHNQFVLYLDEAGLLSRERERDSDEHVLKVMGLLKTAAHHAAHVVLLTGTPQRHDGGRLPFADYTPDEKKPGLYHLKADATRLYQYGRARRWLRRFDDHLLESAQDWGKTRPLVEPGDDGALVGPQHEQYTTWLKDGERRISKLVGDRPFVDRVLDDAVEQLYARRNEARKKDKRFPYQEWAADCLAMLITCKHTQHANEVAAWLGERHPKLRIAVVHTNTEHDSSPDLERFRDEPGSFDVLVTVRQAFIGYDAPQISVVVVLTHYRDESHLTQIIGRGLRYWDKLAYDVQKCVVVGPIDPRLFNLCERFREDSLKADAHEREEGEQPPEGDPDVFLGSRPGDAEIFTEEGRFVWRETRAAQQAMQDAGIHGVDEFDFLKAMRQYAQRVSEPTPPAGEGDGPVVDEGKLCDSLRKEIKRVVRACALKMMQADGIQSPNGHWEKYTRDVQNYATRRDRRGYMKDILKDPDALTIRLTTVRGMLDQLS